VKSPHKPRKAKAQKSGPKSLLDIPKRRLRKLAKAAERKLIKAARPPTPEQLAQRVELLRAIMEGQEVVRVPRFLLGPTERNAQTAPAEPTPQKRHRPKSEPALSAADWLSAQVAQRKAAGDIPTSMTVFAKQLALQMDADMRAGKCLEALAWPFIRRRLYGKKLRKLLALR
jgi:hypothetical protein